MTKSRRLDDGNVEKRRTWLTWRRVVACMFVAAAVGAVTVIGESLRRSTAQLGATVATTIEDVRMTPVPTLEPRAAGPLEMAGPSELEGPADVDIDAEGSEVEDVPLPTARGPIAADEFAQLVEAGVLRDVDAGPDAAADLRRVLEAAAGETDP